MMKPDNITEKELSESPKYKRTLFELIKDKISKFVHLKNTIYKKYSNINTKE